MLDLLADALDVTRVPFSDRGSRLLVYKDMDASRLHIKLAERLADLEPAVDAYLRRPPFVRDFAFIDENGQPLEFELHTSPDLLRFETRLGEFAMVFQEGRILVIGLPQGQTAGVRFNVLPNFYLQASTGGELKSVRNIAYASNGGLLTNRIEPDRGGYTIELLVEAGIDRAITLHISTQSQLRHEVAAFSESRRAARARWETWFSRVPPVDPRFERTYAYAWWVMANNLVSPQGNLAYEAMMPSKIAYVGIWLWDSALHALAFRHLDPELARNQLRAMLAYQSPSGRLPDAIHDEGIVSEIDHPLPSVVTKPPILAWAAMKLHASAPDIAFLSEIYEPLVRLNGWWLNMNDDDNDGLAQYNHPYSSGLDDNPLWDYGMPVESPDLNTYLCLQMDALAHMAEALGNPTDAAMWKRRSQAIVRRMMEDFWDEQAGLFQALCDEKPIPVVTPLNLFPLWTGRLPDAVRDRLIAHLVDPQEFWGNYVVPTVARNDPHYEPGTMWRGPIWANINYFLVEALRAADRPELARQLRDKTLDLIMEHPGIYEYYNPDTGKPPEKAASIFGWTAALFIDMALEASAESGA